MGSLTRRCLYTAAAMLLAGVLTGLTLLIRRDLFGIPPAPLLVSAHAHLLLVGALFQIVFGVALGTHLRQGWHMHDEPAFFGWF